MAQVSRRGFFARLGVAAGLTAAVAALPVRRYSRRSGMRAAAHKPPGKGGILGFNHLTGETIEITQRRMTKSEVLARKREFLRIVEGVS